MTVLITLTTAGEDSGPFDLYSDLDGYTTPFETGVSRINLLAGYSSALVPDGTQIIKVQSSGMCVNYLFLILEVSTTTTTSTSSTTTTTTTLIPACIEYTVQTAAKTDQNGTYTDCYGNPGNFTINALIGSPTDTFCALEGSIVTTGQVVIIVNSGCTTTTTTSTSTTSTTTTIPPTTTTTTTV